MQGQTKGYNKKYTMERGKLEKKLTTAKQGRMIKREDGAMTTCYSHESNHQHSSSHHHFSSHHILILITITYL